ncbi:MAG TPA: sulfite exporter TauE/SafE family protein [Mycobacteriales bacterium]
MSIGADLAVLAAGLVAGTINAVVGSGSLVTFPTLLAVGLPPLTANVSNTVGLVPGSVAGAVGYRRELAASRRHLFALVGFTAAGAVAGAALLLALPSSIFDKAVPVLVLLAVALMAAQPRLAARLAAQGRAPQGAGWALRLGVFATGVYGGYFGAAQGVILLGLLGLLLPVTLQQANGVKNVLGGLANLVAGVAFILVAHVDWAMAGLVAAGSSVGGVLGARYGRRLSAPALRRIVVVAGTVVGVVLLVQNHG